MKNVILVSIVLTLLASCTLMPEKSMTPDTMQKPETKMDSTMMMDDKKMMDDSMMKADAMMSGSMEKPMMDDKMTSGTDMMKKEDDVMDKSTMMDDKKMMTGTMDDKKMIDDTIMKKDTEAMMKPTGYMAYDAAKVDAALASGQKVALFFHATWCPSCKALDKAISADTVPSDAVVFKVDYDTSIDLKKKYRVVGQHTTVILNADGSEKSKKLGARTVAEVLN